MKGLYIRFPSTRLAPGPRLPPLKLFPTEQMDNLLIKWIDCIPIFLQPGKVITLFAFPDSQTTQPTLSIITTTRM